MLMAIKLTASDTNGCKDRCDLRGLLFTHGFASFARWLAGLSYFIFVTVLNFSVLESGNVQFICHNLHNALFI